MKLQIHRNFASFIRPAILQLAGNLIGIRLMEVLNERNYEHTIYVMYKIEWLLIFRVVSYNPQTAINDVST